MSHQPERKEKNCLNCGAGVYGRFCHVCGQENIVTHQSFWSLAKHFVFDILHFDGKFFHTLGYLFSRPGFVARQYVQGRRVSYLDPIRMYLFTSAFFFLVFFSADLFHLNVKGENQELTAKERQKMVQKLQDKLQKRPGDSTLLHNLTVLSDTSKPVDPDTLNWEGNSLLLRDSKYTSARQYDSAQAALPQAERDGWIVRRFTLQSIHINQKYGRSNEMLTIYLETFLHKLPYLLFLSLPFFALILKMLYSRRKNFYYSDHAVFTLYHYILSFILILLIFASSRLQDWTGWGVLGYVTGALYFGWPVFLLFEMKNFYQQRWGKTIGKFLLLNFLGLIVLILLFLIFLIFSIFQL